MLINFFCSSLQTNDKKNGFTNVGELEGCVHFKIGEFAVKSLFFYLFGDTWLFGVTSVFSFMEHFKQVIELIICWFFLIK